MKNKLGLIGSLLLIIVLSPAFLVGMVLVMFLEYGDALKQAIQQHSFKYLLWEMNMLKSCPFCGGKITMHGFEPEERYTCDNEECEFNAD